MKLDAAVLRNTNGGVSSVLSSPPKSHLTQAGSVGCNVLGGSEEREEFNTLRDSYPHTGSVFA
jgi:hypothetical protein